MDDHLRDLVRVGELQQAAISAAMEGERLRIGGDDAADAAFEAYFGHARHWLDAILAFNARWPSTPFEVEPVAQPLVQTLLRQADFAAAQGQRQRADAHRREALALTDRHLGQLSAAAVRRGQASRLAVEGRFNEALLTLDAARRVLLDSDQLLAGAQASLDLAQIYDWLGDLDRAHTLIMEVRHRTEHVLIDGPPSDAAVLAAVQKQAAAILEGRASRAGEDAAALQRIAYELLAYEARILIKRGDPAAAEPILRRIVPHYRGVGAGEAIEFHIAVAAARQGRPVEASAMLDRLAGAFEHGLMRPRRPALRMVRADLALDLGDPNTALAHADDGLADLHHHPDPDLSWKLQWRRAQALRALHRDREALAAFVQAVSDADDLRKGSLGYRLDTTFVGDKLELFGAAIELACDRHDGTSAARIIELVKARALAATMSIPPEQRAGRGTVETEFDELSMRIDALSFQQYADRATKETVLERRALLARRRDVVERLRIADPRWRAMSEPVAFDVGRTLERLADGDRAALTLHHRDNKIVAVLLKDGRARVASTRLPDRVIEAVDAYTANLRRSRPDEFAFDLSTEGGVGWRDLVPAVLAEDALSAGTLLVVPHGRLHLLPWAGLETGDGRAFQRTAVGLLPNLTALTVLDAETTTGAVALIGDPDYRDLSRYQALPEAGAEIGEIAALYRSRRKPVRGRDATEAAFWALTERDGAERCVLHVVCHADLDATDPLTSGLILTRSRVDAGEIALRRIPCPEVVLSACSTAWRPDRAENLELTGDDALGLVASFLEAGARFVLASLPPVLDNAARAFATGWHRHRLAGASPLQAVRGVQEELIRRADLPVWSWIGITGYGCR